MADSTQAHLQGVLRPDPDPVTLAWVRWFVLGEPAPDGPPPDHVVFSDRSYIDLLPRGRPEWGAIWVDSERLEPDAHGLMDRRWGVRVSFVNMQSPWSFLIEMMFDWVGPHLEDGYFATIWGRDSDEVTHCVVVDGHTVFRALGPPKDLGGDAPGRPAR